MSNTISKVIHNGTEFEFESVNGGVTSVNGQTGDVIVDSSNTKTFYLSSTSDLTNAQAAYDWYKDGKNPIIVLQNTSYTLSSYIQSPEQLIFMESRKEATTGASLSTINNKNLSLGVTSETVTTINLYNNPSITGVLLAGVDYSTSYTPEYNGSPATKKYVDDSVSSAISAGSTAPSNPTEGQLWYDTTNDVLKVYDGTNWDEVGKEYNAGPGIEIGTYNDYSAMRGPCPEGFHVPTITELDNIKGIWVSLGGGSSDGTNFMSTLKIPLAGCRWNSSSNVGNQGSYCHYWSASKAPGNNNNAKSMIISSNTINTDGSNYRSTAYTIRCFKDSAIIPTSSWTKLYGTSIETGGIFRNSILGLISLSSDGQTWITIADKNLGATTVWNSGDTLSEANCGKYYQWGNNYGFPRTGTISSTSTTQVDATNYGPGNYYNSSTFITRGESPYGWDSSNNGNLRGGETGVVTLENAITNTGVLSVNGQDGDVVIDESNTKTFYLSSTSDLTTAQAAYDWILAGKEAVINYDGKLYILSYTGSSYIDFRSTDRWIFYPASGVDAGGVNYINFEMQFSLNNNSVTNISASQDNELPYIPTSGISGDGYVPTLPCNPATKKYVDDHAGIPNDTTGTTSSIGAEWVGTQAEFDALSSYSNKIYNIIE